MCAEIGIDVLWEEFPVPVSVLRPVGVVADSQEWMGCYHTDMSTCYNV